MHHLRQGNAAKESQRTASNMNMFKCVYIKSVSYYKSLKFHFLLLPKKFLSVSQGKNSKKKEQQQHSNLWIFNNDKFTKVNCKLKTIYMPSRTTAQQTVIGHSAQTRCNQQQQRQNKKQSPKKRWAVSKYEHKFIWNQILTILQSSTFSLCA